MSQWPVTLLKKFSNYKIIKFIIIWLNITLLDKEDWGGFYQKQKFQYGNFIFIAQFLNDVKYIFTWTLKISDHCILSTKPLWGGGGGLIILALLRMGLLEMGGGLFEGGLWGYLCAQPFLSLSIVIAFLFNIYV